MNGLFYLSLFVPILTVSLWITKEKVLKDEPIYLEYAVGTLIVLFIWGEAAIQLKEWVYPRNGDNLGLYVGNHPIEAIILGIIMPLFVISIWEFIKKNK